MVDTPALNLVVDSSQPRAARQDLLGLADSSIRASEAAQRLNQSYAGAAVSARDFRTNTEEMVRGVRGTVSALDEMIDRVARLTREIGAFSGPVREMRSAIEEMGGVARVFGTGAAGLENFSRAARQVGLDAQETVQALRRIQSAMEGVTAEGRQVRAVLEGYGVRVEGRSSQDADLVLREFTSARRGFQADPLSRFEDVAVLGPLSGESQVALSANNVLTDAQRQRRDQMREQSRQAAALRERAGGALRMAADRQAYLDNLRAEYDTRAFGWNRGIEPFPFEDREVAIGYFERQQAFARENGIPSRSEAERIPFDNNYGYSPLGYAAPQANIAYQLFTAARRTYNLASNWWGSDDLASMRLGLRARYELGEGGARRAGLSEAGDMGFFGYQAARARATFGLLDWDDPRLQLPEEARPVNPRTAAYDRGTAALRMTGAQSALDQEQRQVIADAGYRFGVDTSDFDRIPADAMMARMGPGRAGDQRRAAIEGRLGALDEARFQRMGDAQADRDRVRSSGLLALEEEGTFGAERARREVEARAEAMLRLRDAERQRLAVAEQMRDFDEEVRRASAEATKALQERTDVLVAQADAMGRLTRGATGADRTAGAEAMAAGADAAAQATYRLNPRGATPEAQARQALGTSMLAEEQRRAGLAQQLAEAEARVAAYRSEGAEGARRVSEEIERQARAAEMLAAAIRVFGGDVEKAKAFVADMTADSERMRAAFQGSENALFGLRRDTAVFGDGFQQLGDVEGALSGDMRQVRRERFYRANAEQELGQDPRLQGLEGAERRRRAYEIAREDPDVRTRMDEMFRQQQDQSVPDQAALQMARRQLQRLEANPDPRAQAEVARLRAAVLAMARGESPANIALAIGDADLAASGAQMQRTAAAFYAQGNATADAQAGAASLLGGRMPTAGRVSGYDFSGVRLRDQDIERRIREEAQRQGVDPDYAVAVAQVESGGRQLRPDGQVVTSSAGARGVFQLMPRTARGLRVDPDDLDQNIRGGVTYLRDMLGVGRGDPMAGYAAYNAGPNGAGVRAFAEGGPESALPEETRGALPRLRALGVARYAPDAPVVPDARQGLGGSQRELEARLYARDAFEARMGAVRAVRGGQIDEGSMGAYERGETTRRAAEAIEEFAKAALSAAVALAQGEERMTAGNRWQRGQIEAVQQVRPQATRLRALGRGDEADDLEEQARRRYRQQSQARFQEEGWDLDDRLDDAEFRRSRWYLSSPDLQRGLAMRQAERRLGRDESLTPEQRRQRVEKTGELAEMEEIGRQNQLIRDSFYQVGQVGASALAQIGQRGVTLRTVLQGVAADAANIMRNLATRTLLDQAWKWAGRGLDALLNGGTGAAVEAAGAGMPSGSLGGGTGGLNILGGGLTIQSAQGNVFGPRGVVTAMAQGGGAVFSSPAYLPMANGNTALVGEAGEEAAMPLVRGRDGRLGVIAHGGGGGAPQINVTVNAAPSSGNPARDHEHAASVGRQTAQAIEGMVLDVLRKQARPGGFFSGAAMR